MNIVSRLASSIAVLTFCISIAGPASAAAGASAGITVEPAIAATMNQEGSAGYLIYFRAKPNLAPAASLGRKAQGEFVVTSLRKAAGSAQAGVRAYLDKQQVKYKSFWIDNIILVEQSDKAVFDSLMRFPEIESVKARRTMMLHEPVERKAASPNNPANAPMGVENNITHVKADQVWAEGYTGTGVVVANIDTGVRYTHQALVNQYRGNLGGGSFDHNYNWYDPYGISSSAPSDVHGHGSHTMGTIVGNDGGANQIGMAPGAKWIACRGCSTSGCTEAALLTCGEFIAAPTDLSGANPDPSKRPNVVNNSWGDCGQAYDSWYKTVIDNWQAAGIYPVFSNGNSSNCGYSSPPACNTVGNPARSGNVTGVGSTGQANGRYATHSNLGPTDNLDTINPNGYASIKPQVAAPGVNIRSSVPTNDSTYEGGWSGTSMSAPHVTGLIALMLEAAPCLTYDEAETIIEQTAYLDTTGLPAACTGEGPARLPNQATGWGEIDALAAVNQSLAACGPSGTLAGTVTDASNSNPIAGAAVRVGRRSATTDASGQYTFASVPVGTYTATAAVFGYDNGTATGVAIAEGLTTVQDFALAQKPRVTVSGTVADGSGQSWPLYATVFSKTTGFSTTVMTDPVTGQYSMNLVELTAYDFSVSASGYTTQAATVTVGASPLTRDFSLIINTCDAPGYGRNSLFYENFDASLTPPALPAGWAQADISGTAGDWLTNAGTHYPFGHAAHSSPNLIYFNSYSTSPGSATRLYRTSGADLSGVASATLSFWMYHDTQSDSNDRVQVQVSTDGGSTWNNAGSAVSRYDGTDQWTQHTFDLGAYAGAGKTDVRVAFLATSAFGNDIHIDDVQLSNACSPGSGGLVAGAVTSADNGLPLAGITVQSGASSAATDNSSGVYVLFLSAGAHDVTAVGPAGYSNVTESVSVSSGAVTMLNFILPAAPATTTTPATTTMPVEATTTIPATTTSAISSTTTSAAPATTTTTVKAGPCPAQKVLGSDNSKLENLRALRDGRLANSAMGRKFIQMYYTNAGGINAALERSPALRAAALWVLEKIAPLVGRRE